MADTQRNKTPPVLARNRSAAAAGVKPMDRRKDMRCYSTDSALDYTQGSLDLQEAPELRKSSHIRQHPTIRPGMFKRDGGVFVATSRGLSEMVVATDRVESPDISPGTGRRRSGRPPLPPIPPSQEQDNLVGQPNEFTKKADSMKRMPPVLRQIAKQQSYSRIQPSIVSDGEDTQSVPTWNTYLYQLQQQAPAPILIECQHEVPNRPSQYGKEFHGSLSRQDVDSLVDRDGCYLVRKSERSPDAVTLAIGFGGETKNYKLYFDGKHYVGEKRFDSVFDLVADGLIHFYIELKAADYIRDMSKESNYEESPYMAYNMKRKRIGKSTKPDLNINGSNAEASATADDDHPCPDTDVNFYKKSHLFKVQSFMGLPWCDFCANFMWGIRQQGVKCQDCGMQAHKKCSENVPHDCMPDMKYIKRMYGCDLTTVVKAGKSPVPYIVEKCVKEIETRGLDQEGLYRLVGFHDDVEAIRMAFDKDPETADVSPAKYDDINTICSALKLYFRLLPLPLITIEVCHKAVDIIKMNDLPQSEQIRLLKEQIMSLPPAHFHTLKYLCNHLNRVVQLKSKNMMSFENLAIVFAPTLMRSDSIDPMQSLINAKLELQAMELILVNHATLLGKS